MNEPTAPEQHMPVSVVFAAMLSLQVASASAAPGTAPGVVRGVVFDSTRAVPLAGARVGLLGTFHRSDADSLGRFALDSVPEGRYTLIFWHPRLQELGVSAPPVAFTLEAGEQVVVEAAIPSRETLAAAWCAVEGGRGRVVVAGTVRDSVTGVPLPRALVTLRPAEGRAGTLPARVLETRADTEGAYLFCDVDGAGDGRYSLQASFGTGRSRGHLLVAEQGVDRRGGVWIEDLVVPIASSVAIRGRVVEYGTRDPLPAAEVRLVGSDRVAVTGSDGGFLMEGLPPGLQILETRHLGHETRSDSLTVFNREHVAVEIELATEAIPLDPLVVTARSLDRFDPQALTARFDGLSRVEIEELLPRSRDVRDLVRNARIPGLSVREVTVVGSRGPLALPGICIEHNRRRAADPEGATCNMVEVYVDGVRVADPEIVLNDLDPEHVERIQLLSPAQAGALYGTGSQNGVLRIETRLRRPGG